MVETGQCTEYQHDCQSDWQTSKHSANLVVDVPRRWIGSDIENQEIAWGVRVIPQWAEEALALRLQDQNHGFSTYGAVQQWLAETLGIEAEYHAVYQMTRYRLKAKLKVARPQNGKQDMGQREDFKKTLQTTSPC